VRWIDYQVLSFGSWVRVVMLVRKGHCKVGVFYIHS